jgi:hypothetical protein
MNATKDYQSRFSAALAYYLDKGEPLKIARELARDRLDYEDECAEEEINPKWKGPNDSFPINL